MKSKTKKNEKTILGPDSVCGCKILITLYRLYCIVSFTWPSKYVESICCYCCLYADFRRFLTPQHFPSSKFCQDAAKFQPFTDPAGDWWHAEIPREMSLVGWRSKLRITRWISQQLPAGEGMFQLSQMENSPQILVVPILINSTGCSISPSPAFSFLSLKMYI